MTRTNTNKRPTRRELIDGLSQCYVALAALLPTHPACRDENMLKRMPVKKAREHRLIAVREDANSLVVRETTQSATTPGRHR